MSTGGGFQPFQFAEQGAIAYADNLIGGVEEERHVRRLPARHRSRPTRPTTASLAVPWQLDARLMWANTALLEKAGAEVPTDFDSLLKAGQALKKIGVFGFGTGTGAGNNLGSHTMVAMMIMNGGGLFTPDGKADCVTDRNIEAMTFVQAARQRGHHRPRPAVSYTTDNLPAQWAKGKVGLGIHTAGLQQSAAAVAKDIEVVDAAGRPARRQGRRSTSSTAS